MDGEKRVALVAGVTGIVGLTLAELMLSDDYKGQGPRSASWRVYGVARRPKPAWFQHHSATYLQCDLLDRAHTLATLSPLSTHVTHLFFTTWTNRGAEDDNVQANGDMLRNTLDALLQPPHSALHHVCLQTGAKHYLGSFDTIMARTLDNTISVSVFDEDTPRLPGPNFYYAQEDILLEAVARRKSMAQALTWSVHRAPIILGVSPASLMQMPLFVAAYACICKHDEEGLPFIFTGIPQIWNGPFEAADSRLIADQEIWAAIHPAAHNQAFNVSNGDGITWRDLWPAIASFFHLEVPPYTGESQSLVQILQSKAHVWERIVTRYKLLPTAWDQLVLGWWAQDWCMCKLPPYRLSTAKSARLGFVSSCSDTKASLFHNFRILQAMGLIPVDP